MPCWCASCSSFWSSIPVHHQALGFSSSLFFICFLTFLILNMYTILYCHFSKFIFHLSQPICVFSYFLFLFLPIPWTFSSGLIQIIDSALLSYLSSFAATATNHCRTSSWTFSAPFLFTLNFLLSFDSKLWALNFFANLVVCFLSSGFCNPPSQ